MEVLENVLKKGLWWERDRDRDNMEIRWESGRYKLWVLFFILLLMVMMMIIIIGCCRLICLKKFFLEKQHGGETTWWSCDWCWMGTVISPVLDLTSSFPLQHHRHAESPTDYPRIISSDLLNFCRAQFKTSYRVKHVQIFNSLEKMSWGRKREKLKEFKSSYFFREAPRKVIDNLNNKTSVSGVERKRWIISNMHGICDFYFGEIFAVVYKN